MNHKLDVFEILNGKKNIEKLDVSKILNDNQSQNQEHQNAPDFDLLNVKALMDQPRNKGPVPVKPAATAAQTPAKPAVKPQAPAKQLPAPEKAAQLMAPATASPDAVKTQTPEKPANVKKLNIKPADGKQSQAKPSNTEQAAEPGIKTLNMSKRRWTVWAISKILLIALAVVMVVIFAVACPKVTDDSMAPLISSGDRVLINKAAKTYRPGDIIVFDGTGKTKHVARIVANKGDMVTISDIHGLIINNEIVEDYQVTGPTTVTDAAVVYPQIVDEDEFFVLGDNRPAAADSRNAEIGIVNESEISGKVTFCFKKIK